MKENRIAAIDYMKFFAAFFITNSHLSAFYGDYNFMSRGSFEGNYLFFLCSGFALFLKPMAGMKYFVSWYKKRISRIYPSIFAIAIISSLFMVGYNDTFLDVILAKRYWFVSCIMIHYVLIYLVGSYIKDKLLPVSIIVIITSSIITYNFYETNGTSIWGHYVTRYILSFVVLLLGAYLGENHYKIRMKPWRDLVLLVFFYAGFAFCGPLAKNGFLWADYLRFFPLLGSIYYFYKVCTSPFAKKMYNVTLINKAVRIVGGGNFGNILSTKVTYFV